MTQYNKWHTWKKLAGVGLGLLLAADLASGFFLWQASREGAEAMRAERDLLAVQAKLLKADVKRGEQIRASFPQLGKDCDDFYRESILDGAKGYSAIESDLAAIATKAGIKTSGFSFKQLPIKGRGVTEISISTGVDADYPAVLQFISGLERSKNFYLLDDLHLNSASNGGIRLDLALHTYFRT
jgi:type II secretion system (T2SS) protein M